MMSSSFGFFSFWADGRVVGLLRFIFGSINYRQERQFVLNVGGGTLLVVCLCLSGRIPTKTAFLRECLFCSNDKASGGYRYASITAARFVFEFHDCVKRNSGLISIVLGSLRRAQSRASAELPFRESNTNRRQRKQPTATGRYQMQEKQCRRMQDRQPVEVLLEHGADYARRRLTRSKSTVCPRKARHGMLYSLDPLPMSRKLTADCRLADLKTQETYFERIVARYMKFCASHTSGETLEAAFTNLSLANDTTPSAKPQQPPLETPELPILLMAMRKLREALVSCHRTDAFSQRAYTFIIRASILCRHLESYHPALLYLLHHIHPCTPLSRPEQQEFASYLILDLACRQGELVEAFRLRRVYAIRDRKVDAVLKALVHDDWCLFWRTRRSVDGYQRCLMGWAEQGVRLHALKCLGRAYMMADRGFVERSADRAWEDLVERDKVGWLLQENGVVVIRKPKAK